ncbi:hypothetical protein D515_03509 [Grimontia indica]|uniref:Uncharacterized protein n=1 Tax=Grimontia indica TaxID=1056512 RepID=R1IJT1_9GAMM|nr:hypothetical protein D515_03509 [Grimontia indica]
MIVSTSNHLTSWAKSDCEYMLTLRGNGQWVKEARRVGIL